VGGSSAVNATCAIRGTPDDYQRWAAEFGCDGWGWPEMLAAFLTAEDDADYGGDGRHGKGGPIPLWRPPVDSLPPLSRGLRAALSGLGHPSCDDYHAPDSTGVSRSALTVRDGRRVSTNDAYLEPARARANLGVRGDTLVDRVLLNGRRAVGVRTETGAEIEAGQVIVSAGAIHSPAILLRSGIGVDDGLAAGANLIEHAATAGFELELTESGQMPSTDSLVFNAMLRYSSELAGAGPNGMQIVWFDGVSPTGEPRTGGRILGAVMRVFSRGTVRLRSGRADEDPIVDFNLLADERDLIRLRDAVRRIIELIRHPEVAAITRGALAADTPLDQLDSDAAIDAWLMRTVSDYVHAVGTCRMGRVGEPAAVVDTDCQVIGYPGLRVCDASVMPDLPRANTHLTTVAIAERLSLKLADRQSTSVPGRSCSA
jgi:choline dehydrogenase-like flavoprotein